MIVLRDSCNKEIQQPLIVISEIVSPVVVIDPPPPLPPPLTSGLKNGPNTRKQSEPGEVWRQSDYP